MGLLDSTSQPRLSDAFAKPSRHVRRWKPTRMRHCSRSYRAGLCSSLLIYVRFVRTLETDLAAAERSNRDASRELQAIETSVNISKRNLRDLTAQAQGVLMARFFFFFCRCLSRT